jgi:predicted Zn-dependent peptidase
MRSNAFLAICAICIISACSPKPAANLTPNSNNQASLAPRIPLPQGDVRKSAPKPGAAPVIQIGKAQTVVLDNGLTLIVVENHKLPTLSVQLFVDYDPVLEKESKGYVDMMADLLLKGTKTRTKNQIDEEIDFIGASLNANPNGFFGECLSKHGDKLLNVLSDATLNPSFPADELERSRKRQVSNLAQSKTDANFIVQQVSAAMRYGKSHPYGEIKTEASINKITLQQIQQHYNTYFKPNIAYLVLVGDITREKGEKYARQYFGKWQKGEVPKESYGLPRPPDKNEVDFVNKPGAVQSVINITYPIELTPGHPDEIRARLLNTILGAYFNSRVNSNLREKHGWTYGANTRLSSDKLIGYFSATASVRNGVTDSAIVEFLNELYRIKTEKVPLKEFQMVKNVLTGQFSQNLESPETIARFALSAARFGLPADYFQQYLTVLQSITADEVMLMARKYIKPDHAYIVVAGNQAEVAEKLAPFDANHKVLFFDAFANPVRMNAMPLPPDMTGEKVIQDYLNAIHADKIVGFKDLFSEGKLQLSGPELEMKTWQKAGEKIAIEMKMNGQVISKRVFDGIGGNESGMAGATRSLEGKALEDLKEQAAFCKELAYLSGTYKLDLKQIDEINGVNAYAIEVTRKDGKRTMEFYDVKTSLKLREITLETGNGPTPVSVTTDFSDYKAVEGVLFPHNVTLTGLTPAPMTLVTSQIKVNQGVEDTIFKL